MVNTLEKIFQHELKDAYSAEKQLIKALPMMAEKAQGEDLKANLQMHLEETKGQAKRLESVFEMLDMKPQAQTCKAMQGILAEGGESLESISPEMMDLAITASAARVEHYEMALYTGLHEMASALEYDGAADLIKETLNEEKSAAKKVEAAMKKFLKMIVTA